MPVYDVTAGRYGVSSSEDAGKLSKEEEKARNNFLSFCEALGIVPSEEFFGTLSYLMLRLQAILTFKEEYWEKARCNYDDSNYL